MTVRNRNVFFEETIKFNSRKNQRVCNLDGRMISFEFANKYKVWKKKQEKHLEFVQRDEKRNVDNSSKFVIMDDQPL